MCHQITRPSRKSEAEIFSLNIRLSQLIATVHVVAGSTQFLLILYFLSNLI